MQKEIENLFSKHRGNNKVDSKNEEQINRDSESGDNFKSTLGARNTNNKAFLTNTIGEAQSSSISNEEYINQNQNPISLNSQLNENNSMIDY